MTEVASSSKLRVAVIMSLCVPLLSLAACGGGSAGGGGTGTAPTPTPTPTPPTIPDGITINGSLKTPTALDTLTTRSGHWKFSDLGAVGDSRAYLWKLDENSQFLRVMVCRRAFTTEANDTATLSLQDVTVNIRDAGRSYDWSLKVAQGSCRVMQNMEPVAPNAQWLRDAVTARRIPSFKRERAYLSGLPALAPDGQRGAYDPSSLGPIPGSTATPTSENNFVGVTSGQGGEYAASRGFLHNADARVVDAALHNEDSLITAFMPEFVQYTWYSLAQPQAAAWSQVNHVSIDPQFPQSGDKPFEIAAASRRTRDDVDSMVVTDAWSRDESHLENTAFVHWILTEDPVAGLVVQRQLAFHLGNFYESERATTPTYQMNIQQERGIYNGLTALWKSRDVARRVASANGTVIWGTARLDRMVTESIASIDAQTRAFPSRDVANLTGAVLSPIDAPGEWETRTGGTISYAFESNFQGFQYGKEPMWLWTRDGNATVTGWFRAKTRQAVVRAVYVGGALGVDRAEDKRGSSIPLGPSVAGADGALRVAPNAFATDVDWANWLVAQPIAVQSRTNFDAATLHTTLQMYEMLLFAKDAGLAITDLDTAISRMQTQKAATTAWRFPELQMHKHLGGPPD